MDGNFRKGRQASQIAAGSPTQKSSSASDRRVGGSIGGLRWLTLYKLFINARNVISGPLMMFADLKIKAMEISAKRMPRNMQNTWTNMTVSQSSITAYNQEVRSGKIPSQRRRIYDLLLREGPMTNRMIGKVLNMELGSVSGRVNALLISELIMKSHTAKCPHSGHRVRWVAVTSPQQMEMRI